MKSLIQILLFALAVQSTMAQAIDPRFLKADGNNLVDQKGQVVALRGVNLGSWLVFEPWMCPMDASGLEDDFSAREVLATRFGAATARELLDVYQDNWFTEADLDRIAAQGLNVIRLPFWYRNLMDEDGTWHADPFKRIDWLVSQAWKRGIYTVLDLHGAPGGQTKGVSSGRIRPTAELWNNETNVRRTVLIWQRLAAHFRGNPAVAAYDLLNEPAEAPNLGTLWATYDRLIRAVRDADPDHVISLEGCINTKVGDKNIHWGWEALPHPDMFGWKNMLYQMHNYEWSWNDLDKQKRSVDFQVSEWKKYRAWKVPCFIGEFNPMAPEDGWKHALSQFDKEGMNWAFWSYKATHGTGSNSWGLYNPKEKPAAPNLKTDDAATIRAKWQAIRTDQAFVLNPMLAGVLKASLPARDAGR